MASVIRPDKLDEIPTGVAPPAGCGWPFVLAIGAGEAEVAWWLKHADCLTREERSHLAHGGSGPIVRPLEPGWEVGVRLDVASNLWADVLQIQWRRGGYRTSLKLVDFRPRLPRRTTPYFEPPEFDHDGEAIEPTSVAIEAARQAGQYTQSHGLAVPGIDDEVDAETQEQIAKGALTTYNLVHAEQVQKREIRSLTAQLQEARAAAVKQGIDISPEVAALKEHVARLQAKVGLAA